MFELWWVTQVDGFIYLWHLQGSQVFHGLGPECTGYILLYINDDTTMFYDLDYSGKIQLIINAPECMGNRCPMVKHSFISNSRNILWDVGQKMLNSLLQKAYSCSRNPHILYYENIWLSIACECKLCLIFIHFLKLTHSVMFQVNNTMIKSVYFSMLIKISVLLIYLTYCTAPLPPVRDHPSSPLPGQPPVSSLYLRIWVISLLSLFLCFVF